MRRLAALAALIATTATTAAAAPAATMTTGDATARGSEDLKINFTIQTVDGKPTRIRDFEFRKLIAPCASGGARSLKGSIGSMKINSKKRFDGRARGGGGVVKVKGRSMRGGKKVVGSIRGRGDFGRSEGCDSGKVRWKATRS